MRFLARRIADAGIAIVVATRAAEDEWSALGATAIPLSGLGVEDTRLLLARTGDFAPEVADRLHEATGGNPLALLTVPASLTPGQRVGAEPLEEPLPSEGILERALPQRIGALPVDTQAALVVLAAATGDDAGEIAQALRARGLELAALDEAERAGVVELEPGRARFTHPLYRSAAYHSAPRDERRAAHRAFADGLRDGPDHARRALHLAEATVEPDEDVAAELEAAAADLTSRAAHPQAGLFLERAALLSPAPEDRAARLVLASAAVRERGDGVHAAELAREAAADAPSPRARADADAALGRALMVTGPMDDAAALLASAGRAVAADEPLLGARRLLAAADATFAGGDDRSGRLIAREAARLLRGTNEPERYGALAWIAFARAAAEDTTHVDRVIDLIATNVDATTGDERVVSAAATLIMFADRFRDCAEYCGLVVARARTEGRLTLLVESLRALAQAELRLGRFTEAAAIGTDALLLAEGAGQSVQMTGLLVDLGECAAWRGDEAELERFASRGLGLAQQLDIRSLIASFERLRALIAFGLGRLPEAAERFQRTLAEDVARHPDRYPSARAELVEVLVRLGELEAAQSELDVLTAFPVRERAPRMLSVEERCRGLLAPDDEFEACFRRALELHPLFEDEAVKARNLLAYGMALRRARRPTDARVQLRAAAEAFERCGAWVWARHAGSELRAAGGGAFVPRAVAGETLTPQEYQVAQLVATGATNREVGAALFLSVKTVEAHLSRIYRKLGISSRRALTRALES